MDSRTRDTLKIVPAQAGDARLLAELGRRTFHAAFAHNNDPKNLGLCMDALFGEEQQAAELADPARTVFLAYEGEDPIGYAHLVAGSRETCIVSERPLELRRFYFEPRAYGTPHTHALMRHCLEFARSGRFQEIWLGVWEENPRAMAFYRKYGFRQVGSHPFMVGPEVQTDLIFTLAL